MDYSYKDLQKNSFQVAGASSHRLYRWLKTEGIEYIILEHLLRFLCFLL